MNLLSILPEKDHTLIHNYIAHNGIRENLYIGNEKYLKFWAENKETLYKLLGNQFIVKIPLDTIPEEMLANLNRGEADRLYSQFASSVLADKLFRKNNFFIDWYHLFAKNSLGSPYKYTDKKGNEKVLPAGTKFAKVLKFLVKHYEIDTDQKTIDEMITLQSLVFNKNLKGNLCLSIHPLDFMTMSNNNHNWSSCMSWLNPDTSERGCYCQGTVEMMNSPHVICAYIESPSKTYCFNPNAEDKENYTWNSKAWRELFVVDNLMICSGKGYPYNNSALSEYIVGVLRDMAVKNLNLIKLSEEVKPYTAFFCNAGTKRVFITTNGMYNDWFNDTDTDYFCCMREGIDSDHIINISGPDVCLCCGEEVLEPYCEYSDEDLFYDAINGTYSSRCEGCTSYKEGCEEWCEDYEDEYDIRERYNDRFEETRRLICTHCLREHKLDAVREEIGRTTDWWAVNRFGGRVNMTYQSAHICSCCGKVYIVDCYSPYRYDDPHSWSEWSLPRFNLCNECSNDIFDIEKHPELELHSTKRENGIIKISYEYTQNNIKPMCKYPQYLTVDQEFSKVPKDIKDISYEDFVVQLTKCLGYEILYSPEEYTKYLQDKSYTPKNYLMREGD